MREAIDVDDYCAALLTWATTKSSSDSEIPDHARKEALAALRSGCDFLRASRAGSARIQDLCHAMRDWADSQPEGSFLALLSADAPKSCLLFRLIYAGERLRTHPGAAGHCASVAPGGLPPSVAMVGRRAASR